MLFVLNAFFQTLELTIVTEPITHFLNTLFEYLAKLAADAISASNSPQASLMAGVAKFAIIVLAGSIGLRQMGLANEIVTLAFTCLIGAGAAAIAFGIGGRDTAAKMVDRWAESIGGDGSKSKK